MKMKIVLSVFLLYSRSLMSPYSTFLFLSANRYSPSKRVRNSIVPMKSSSQELLSPQREERPEDRAERLVAARSLASLDGQGEQNHHHELIPLVGLKVTTSSERDQLKLLAPMGTVVCYMANTFEMHVKQLATITNCIPT